MKDRNGILGVIKRWLPSIFDVYVIGIVLLVGYWPNGYEKNLFYNFGVLSLWGLCLAFKPKRVYSSLPLALLLFWSLSNVFFHAWDIDLMKGKASYYLNVCLLSESYIYFFSSIMLFKLIVTYAKRYEYYFVALLIAAIPLFKRMVHQGTMTPILAIPLAFVMYGFFNRKWKPSLLATLIGANIVAWNWKWVAMKFYVRPLVWRTLWDEFIQHPWIGQGYWRALDFNFGDLIWIKYDSNYGPAYRHSDYLNLGVYIGTAAVIFVICFILKEIIKMRHHPACILFMALAIIPAFQMTFLELNKAVFTVVAMATAVAASGVYENKSISG